MTARLCVLCSYDLTPTELQTCALCVSLVRLDLTSIEHCYALLPGLLGRPDGASLDSVMGGLSGEAALPGGDILAMLGPGSAATSWGDEREGGPAGDPSDPPAVAFELWTWADDWAEIRGEDSKATGGRVGTLVPPERVRRSEVRRRVAEGVSVAALVAWLGKRLSWAGSHHPAFVEFAGDMARIRKRLEVATAMDDAPERGETCPYCGGTLSRRYLATGREDDWSCPRCHRMFNDAQYRMAVAMALRGA